MKRFLFILTGLFFLQTAHIAAQEMTKEENKAAQIEAKEAKRKAKEEKKAAKEEGKAMKAIDKAEKKQAEREDDEAKFQAFIAEWKPVEYADIDSVKMPNVVDLFRGSNELFSTMKNVYSYIDYVQIETKDTVDAEGIAVTEYQKLDANGNELKKYSRLQNMAQASLDLTNASLLAANVLLSGPLAMTDALADPLTALTLGKRVKRTYKSVQMAAKVIPLLRAKVGDNKVAREQDKNN